MKGEGIGIHQSWLQGRYVIVITVLVGTVTVIRVESQLTRHRKHVISRHTLRVPATSSSIHPPSKPPRFSLLAIITSLTSLTTLVASPTLPCQHHRNR